jgi:tight adherence protein B
MTVGIAAAIAMALLVAVVASWARTVPARRAHRVTRARLVAVVARPVLSPAAVRGFRAPAWFVRSIIGPADVGEPGQVDLVWRWWAGGIAAVSVGTGVVGGAAAGAVVAVVALAGSPLAARWWRARQDRRLDEQLPAFLDAVASGLRSGSSLSVGVLDAARGVPPPLRGRLRPVVTGVRAGSPLDVELDAWLGRQRSSSVAVVVGALALGLGAGGPQADTVDAIGDTLRDRLAVAGEIRALASQARASAAVIVVAPVVFAVVAAVADPAVLQFLLGTPAGLGCLVGGAALDAAGAAWMRSITRGDR